MTVDVEGREEGHQDPRIPRPSSLQKLLPPVLPCQGQPGGRVRKIKSCLAICVSNGAICLTLHQC